MQHDISLFTSNLNLGIWYFHIFTRYGTDLKRNPEEGGLGQNILIFKLRTHFSCFIKILHYFNLALQLSDVRYLVRGNPYFIYAWECQMSNVKCQISNITADIDSFGHYNEWCLGVWALILQHMSNFRNITANVKY